MLGNAEFELAATDLSSLNGAVRYIWSCSHDKEGVKLVGTFSRLEVSGGTARSSSNLSI